jgi:hypothetical protein
MDLTGSIGEVQPTAILTPDHLFTGAGGLAAAIAIGGFLCQAWAVVKSASDSQRRRHTAIGGLAGLTVMIGLILYSISGR